LRLKHLSELRPGLERPSAWLFWHRFLFGSAAKYARMIAIYACVARSSAIPNLTLTWTKR
jgi:hypothetical protein